MSKELLMSHPIEDQRLRVVVMDDSSTAKPQLLTALLESGYQVTVTRGDGPVSPADGGAVVVLGDFGDSTPDISGEGDVYVESITGLTTTDVIGRVASAQESAGCAAPGEWTPWFPVIDYERCTNCMQCLSFCLFGVYGVDADKEIQVQNQEKCKTNCPACSRVCPEAAIMFPKYRSGPVNGEEVSSEGLEREKMKIDISSLLGGDIYQALRERSEQATLRFSRERDEERALKERKSCLIKLQQEMDIPPDVLMSLPSPEEITRRAQEAKELADEALKASMARRREGLD
jgi:Pyruvate/2-oxoacid:ferredoxin oxidoreductase delta subunit